MPLQVDFAIAFGVFLVSLVFILSLVLNYSSNQFNLLESSRLKMVSMDLFKLLFENEGLPENWEETLSPLKIGLATKLHRIPLVLTEENGTNRIDLITNVSLLFDPYCLNESWSSSIRVYDEENREIAYKLYNQTFCSQQFVKSADLVLKLNLSANQRKVIFVYFSPQKTISSSSYNLPFQEAENVSFQVFPQQTFRALSVEKLQALRKLEYEDLVEMLGMGYKFRVEVEGK